MFVNLHTQPLGKSMFTAYVTNDPEGTPRSQMEADEVDIVAPSSATWGEVVNYGLIHDVIVDDAETNAGVYIRDMYGLDSRIVGVVNQSAGYVLFDAFESGEETGANDRA